MPLDYEFVQSYRRIQETLLVSTQQQLADALDISQASVCAALTRRSIPPGWLLKLCLEKRLNPLWILYGDIHKKYLIPTDEVPDERSCGSSTLVSAEAVSGSPALMS